MNETVALRHATPNDQAFIMASWLRSQRDAPFAMWMDDQTYHAHVRPFLTRLLIWCDVMLAVNKDDPTQIFGFAVYEPGEAIHFVYVKNAFRRIGFGTLLAAQAKTRMITCAPRFPLSGWTIDAFGALETAYGRRSRIPQEANV